MLSIVPDQPLRILHVEDDEDMRDITAMSLEMTGSVTLHQFSSGEHALNHIVELDLDVIILDVTMPRMNGPDLLRAIREIPKFSDTPILFMTAHARQELIDGLIKNGARGVIIKPFEPEDLLPQIQSILS